MIDGNFEIGRTVWRRGRRITALLLMTVLTVFTGCGEPGVGSSGTGYSNGSQLGTVTGFSSIVVESNRYDDSNATVSLSVQADQSSSAQLDDVQIGMQVLVQFDQSDRADTIRIIPQLIGRVDSVGTATISVAGQTIVVMDSGSRPTVREGFERLDELVGQRIRVFGQINDSGLLQATRIENRHLQDGNATLVTGVVTSARATALQIGALQAGLPAQNMLNPDIGDIVSVYANAEPVNGMLNVERLSIRGADNLTGEAIRFAGVIRRQFGDGNLRVGPVLVDGSEADIQSESNIASVNDLAPGQVVRVRGRRDGGQFRAQTIAVLPTRSELLEVTGAISDFFSLSSFRVRGVLIDASSATINGGQIGNLTDDAQITVRGTLSGGRLFAQSVDVRFADHGRAQSLLTQVSSYNPLTGSLRVLGLPATVNQQTRFFDSAGQPVASSRFANGVSAVVRGNFDNGLFVITDVVILAAANNLPRTLTGAAYAVDRGQQRLTVATVPVVWNAQTVIEGDLNALRNGTPVQVTGIPVNNGLLAARLVIRAN